MAKNLEINAKTTKRSTPTMTQQLWERNCVRNLHCHMKIAMPAVNHELQTGKKPKRQIQTLGMKILILAWRSLRLLLENGHGSIQTAQLFRSRCPGPKPDADKECALCSMMKLISIAWLDCMLCVIIKLISITILVYSAMTDKQQPTPLLHRNQLLCKKKLLLKNNLLLISHSNCLTLSPLIGAFVLLRFIFFIYLFTLNIYYDSNSTNSLCGTD